MRGSIGCVSIRSLLSSYNTSYGLFALGDLVAWTVLGLSNCRRQLSRVASCADARQFQTGY